MVKVETWGHFRRKATGLVDQMSRLWPSWAILSGGLSLNMGRWTLTWEASDGWRGVKNGYWCWVVAKLCAVAWGNCPEQQIPLMAFSPTTLEVSPDSKGLPWSHIYEVRSVTWGTIFYSPVLLAMNKHLKFPRRKLWFYYEINFPLTQVQKAVWKISVDWWAYEDF